MIHKECLRCGRTSETAGWSDRRHNYCDECYASNERRCQRGGTLKTLEHFGTRPSGQPASYCRPCMADYHDDLARRRLLKKMDVAEIKDFLLLVRIYHPDLLGPEVPEEQVRTEMTNND